jgi:dipeptidyl aminopeptidase/acylaminoacyl peptidase
MKRVLFAIIVAIGMATAASAQQPVGLQTEDLFNFKRVSEPQISPDGRTVAYVIQTYDKAKNSSNRQIWLVPAGGGSPRQITSTGSNDRPRWSPDGRQIAFISNREGGPQIWVLDIAAGGEARKVTSISTGVGGHAWSPDGLHFVFASDVYPECADDDCNRKKAEAVEANKVKAKVATRLLYRHWNFWKDGMRTHVFVVPASGGVAKDHTPGDYDAPPFASGSQDGYAISPDGKELCYATNTDAVEATSTNSDLMIVPVGGGTAKRITGDNKGWDGNPVYSPDGKSIAFRSQERAGFEADTFRIKIYDRNSGAIRTLTATLDRSIDRFVWTPDGRSMVFTAGVESYEQVFSIDVASGRVTNVAEKVLVTDLSMSRDGKTIAWTNQNSAQPTEVFVSSVDGTGARQVTDTNRQLLSQRAFSQIEDMWTTAADGTKIHSLLAKPIGFDPAKKYPMLVLIHGGPQGAWQRNFHYRWNPQIYTAAGYVVLMPNPRGSTGFGQAYTDAVTGDWGGKPFTDIMSSVDEAAKLPYVDANRIGAAGASYGGYMINWILGHTDRFKVLVSHAGIYNLTSMAGVTEELWFTEWEFKGTPWTNRDMYERFSPHNFVTAFKTPTLVIHGELDYRVPVGEGMMLFTALQRQNVPSKLVIFPDEAHHVLKPQNAEMWHRTVLDWLGTHLKP